MSNRIDTLIAAFEKLGEMPPGEVRDTLTAKLSELLTIREATELAAACYGRNAGEDISVYTAVVLALYEALKIPLDTPMKDLSSDLEARIEGTEPLMQEFGRVVRQITNKLKP